MFKEDISAFFTDFAETACLANDEGQAYQLNVILNKDANVVNEFDQVVEKITTIDLPSSFDVSVGDTFTLTNSDIYKVDNNSLSDDGSIQSVSVVKQ